MSPQGTGIKVAKASAIITTAFVAGYLLSLIKEIIVARRFGISGPMDAYYAAVAIPNLLAFVFVASVTAVFIPVYINHRRSDPLRADRFGSLVINKVMFFSVAVAILHFLLAPVVIYYGFRGLDPETAVLAVSILRTTSAMLILFPLLGIFGNILNTFEHFTAPALAHPLIQIAILGLLLTASSRYGVHVLVYGLIGGSLLSVLMVITVSVKYGFRYSAFSGYRGPFFEEFTRPLLLYVIVIISRQLIFFTDRAMAARIGPGSVSVIGYSQNFMLVPLTIFAVSVATALFPYFSIQAAEKKISEMKDTVKDAMRFSAFIFFPLTAFALLLSGPFIQVLFERGSFTSSATFLTSSAFSMYSLQFFFHGAELFLARFFLALRDVGFLFRAALFQVTANLILNMVFVRIINPPVAGLALSTSLVFIMIVLYYIRYLPVKGVSLNYKSIFSGIGKSFAAAVFTGIVLYLLRPLFQEYFHSASTGGQAILLALYGFSGIIVYLLILILIKSSELKDISRYIKRPQRLRS